MDIITGIPSIVGVGTLATWVAKGVRLLYIKYYCVGDPREQERQLDIKADFQRYYAHRDSPRSWGEVLIRDSTMRSDYPDPDRGNGISSWFKATLKGLYFGGIEVYISMPFRVEMDVQSGLWNRVTGDQIDDTKLVWEVGRVPYRNIARVDWSGDEYNPFPHIFCQYRGPLGEPYESRKYYTEQLKMEHLWPLEDSDYWFRNLGLTHKVRVLSRRFLRIK